jgi:hypothetical protein
MRTRSGDGAADENGFAIWLELLRRRHHYMHLVLPSIPSASCTLCSSPPCRSIILTSVCSALLYSAAVVST